jgi:tetratricopeptide (TPR) repeat protein
MADAALALDPRCHRALLGRGLARWLGEWDWSGAEADLQRRLAAAPWDSATRAAYAQLLLFGGREAAARDEIARALGRAPDSVEARLTAALISWMMDRPEEAREHYLRVLRQDPGHPEARTSLAKLARGPLDSAADGSADSAVGSAASLGDGVPLQRLEEMAGKRRLRPGHVAVLYAETGRSGEALEWLERAVAEHDPTVLFFRFDRRWDPLREHSRYRRAMASLGLPAASAAS